MKPSITPRLLNSKDAAAYLGVKRSTFFIIRPSLNIKPVVLSKSELWDVKDIDRIVEEKKEVQSLAELVTK